MRLEAKSALSYAFTYSAAFLRSTWCKRWIKRAKQSTTTTPDRRVRCWFVGSLLCVGASDSSRRLKGKDPELFSRTEGSLHVPTT